MSSSIDRAVSHGEQPELSIVIPCLNEGDTIGICIDKALRAMTDANLRGEVIIADNGSTDDSRAIAEANGARVIAVPERGYGAALMAGITASRASLVLMGDADDSYDFLEVDKFVKAQRSHQADLVQGCRFPAGGGQIVPGAMPFLHRWLGNPVLSWLVRRMFHVKVTDVYCGMRLFTRELYESLDMRCPGMEFATEMIIKSGMHGARIVQVPITLHPDGRQAHGPHLRTFRDGWRTLRLFMIYSPRWTFLVPGIALMFVGSVVFLAALPQTRIAGIALDVHSMLVASLFIIVGYQSTLFAMLGRTFAAREGMIPEKPWLHKLTLEKGLVGGVIGVLAGASLIAGVVVHWAKHDFGPLDYPTTMRLVIPGMMLATLGVQTWFASLFLGVLTMHPRRK